MTHGTVREVLKRLKGDYDEYEVYAYTSANHHMHNDYISNVDEVYSESEWMDREVIDFLIADEEEYNHTIMANTSDYADFAEWYGNKNAKVLIMVLSEYWNNEED